MNELNQKNIPFYSVSTIFRENHVFFKYSWFAKQLHHVTYFFVQDQRTKKMINSIGIYNVIISGDTRFDNVISKAKNTSDIPLINMFCKKKQTESTSFRNY